MSSPSAVGKEPRLIELDSFPFEFLSALAERESWRKEIHRPIYHLHKWWAVRLGSVFRGILLGSLLPASSDLQRAFYEQHSFPSVRVFDPFMGSGTTIGEAHKLGCTAIGRDINPVACESVRVALGPLDRGKIEEAFTYLSSTVGTCIRDLYRTSDAHGTPSDVLYYFWVKTLACPTCHAQVDLFPSYIFARNAYPDRKPQARFYCPSCQFVFSANVLNQNAVCPQCGYSYDPRNGPANLSSATCPSCASTFSIAPTVRVSGHPPAHRLYAKLVLTPTGQKEYLPITDADIKSYQAASSLLTKEIAEGRIRLPDALLADGYNTRQAIGYNYRNWRDFFNDRQLLALGWLQDSIAALPDPSTRDALLLLFSGALEFNNLFASYKGEGTGAVRHMFSHHILKPERMPIEANVWGTPRSSGGFSNLFKSRLLRAIEYRAAPWEVSTTGSGKSRFFPVSFQGAIESALPPDADFEAGSIYLSCGSSHSIQLPAACVDLVVTDPPFFDNVHYSQLADFFNAWQSLYPRGFVSAATTTRADDEVQDTDPERFSTKLRAVFAECNRILTEDGILVFTYHHSRSEGWTALAEALYGAGFYVLKAHPVKAELSAATPKAQAKEPIQLDVILVCRKAPVNVLEPIHPTRALASTAEHLPIKIDRLQSIGLTLSANDCMVVAVSHFLQELGPVTSPSLAATALSDQLPAIERLLPPVNPPAPLPPSSPGLGSAPNSIKAPPLSRILHGKAKG